MSDLKSKIKQAVNSVSAENGSDTPDFILAEYICDCLNAFDKAVASREAWYGRRPSKEETKLSQVIHKYTCLQRPPFKEDPNP